MVAGLLPMSQPILAAWPDLLGLYVFCLIVGGGLLFISTVLGSHHGVNGGGLDADAGGLDVGNGHAAEALGHGTEHAHGHHGNGALGLSNWLSVRFVVYFAAMFGLVGTVLTWLTDTNPAWTLALALVAGVLMGQFVHQLIRWLQRGSHSGESRIEDLLDKPARVTVAVRPPARGEVGVRLGDREVFLPAIAQRADDVFELGAQVMITSYAGGLAEVVSRQEYEFKHSS
jgi:hypothetical protein